MTVYAAARIESGILKMNKCTFIPICRVKCIFPLLTNVTPLIRPLLTKVTPLIRQLFPYRRGGLIKQRTTVPACTKNRITLLSPFY
jgi:hypothetical protein